jgi:hypothetical protein
MPTDFSLDVYKQILFNLFELGYQCKSFHEAEKHSRHVILRHDVDVSIDYALQMAYAEQEVGAAATYFIMMTSELYNPNAARNAKLLREISNLGHKIGLHFDPSNYKGCSREQLDNHCKNEFDSLRNITGKVSDIVSLHRPEKEHLNSKELIGGHPHTYQPKFFYEIDYCSDSRGGWFHGHPLDRVSIKSGNAMQLLTHPLWWCGKPTEQAIDRLHALIGKNKELFKQSLSENSEPFAKYIAKAKI